MVLKTSLSGGGGEVEIAPELWHFKSPFCMEPEAEQVMSQEAVEVLKKRALTRLASKMQLDRCGS